VNGGTTPNPIPTASQATLDAFKKDFPNVDLATVKWSEVADYEVGTFGGSATAKSTDNAPTAAWYKKGQGQRAQTERDIPYSAVPQAVRSTHESGKYGAWRVDDVDELTKIIDGTTSVIYVIEVEQGDRDLDLYYAADGVFMREVRDDDGNDDNEWSYNHVPVEASNDMKAFIAEKYPNARIIDIDDDYDYNTYFGEHLTEIEIRDGRAEKDVHFNTSSQWVFTETDDDDTVLPQAVKTTINTKYPQSEGWDYDDEANHLETPNDGNFFVVEVENERTDREMGAMFRESGEFVNEWNED
jgi:hypothetical protein